MEKPPDSDNLRESLLDKLNYPLDSKLYGLFKQDPSNLVFKGFMKSDYDERLAVYVEEAISYIYHIDVRSTVFTTEVANTGNGTLAMRIGLDIPELLSDSNEYSEGWFFVCMFCGAKSSAYATELHSSTVKMLRYLNHKAASYMFYNRTCTHCGKPRPGRSVGPVSYSDMSPVVETYGEHCKFTQRKTFPPAAVALCTSFELKKRGYANVDMEWNWPRDPSQICPDLFHGLVPIERTAKFSKLKRDVVTLGQPLCPIGLSGPATKMLMEFVYRLVDAAHENAEPLPLLAGLENLVSIGMVVADFLKFIENANFLTKEDSIINDIWYLTPDGTTAKDFDFGDVLVTAADVMLHTANRLQLADCSTLDLRNYEKQKDEVLAGLSATWSRSSLIDLLPTVETSFRSYLSAIYVVSGVSKPALVLNRLRILAAHSETLCHKSLDGSPTTVEFLRLNSVDAKLWEKAEWHSSLRGVLLQHTAPVTLASGKDGDKQIAKAHVMHEGISLYDTIRFAGCRYAMLTSYQLFTTCVRGKYGPTDCGPFIYRLILDQQSYQKRNADNYSKTLADLLKEDL